MAYYPVNDVYVKENPGAANMLEVRTQENLSIVNQKLEKLAQKMGYHYIDVNENLTDENGKLKQEYTIEGVHMYADAYRIIFENLKPYLVNNP